MMAGARLNVAHGRFSSCPRQTIFSHPDMRVTHILRHTGVFFCSHRHVAKNSHAASLALFRGRRPPPKLYPCGARTVADAKRRLAPDFIAGKFFGRAIVPAYAPRRAADAGRSEE